MTTDSLTAALTGLDPENPLVQRLRDGDGGSAQVPYWMTVTAQAGALHSVLTAKGPGVSDARWLDLTIAGPALKLWTMPGGRFGSTFPPAAFQPVVRSITPGLPVPPARGGAHDIPFGSVFGRSSDGDLPFFLLTDDSGNAGLWFAVAHSGSWHGSLTKVIGDQAHRLIIHGSGSNVDLAEGEHLEMPGVIVGTFTGDGWAAIKSHLDRVGPPAIPPPIFYNSWFNVSGDVNAATCLDNLAVAAETGIEYFVVDAGYYGGEGATFDGPGLGTFEVSTERFPDGLEPISQAAHAAGMGFGLWIEPERAHPESTVAREHPNAMRRAAGQLHHLVDFGKPEIQEWAFRLVVRLVEAYRLDWLKWDFNIEHPLAYWDGDERAELAHYRGVYAVLDRVRDRFPTLIYEHVASGGNRLDICFLSRSNTSILSDQIQSPDIVRAHVGGASLLLPARHRSVGLSPQRVWVDGVELPSAGIDPAYPREWLLSSFAGTVGIFEPLSLWTDATRAAMSDHIAELKRIRPLLDGDYRRFTSLTESGNVGWEAWEFSDPDSARAVLIAFRQGSADGHGHFSGKHKWDVDLEPHDAALLEAGLRP